MGPQKIDGHHRQSRRALAKNRKLSSMRLLVARLEYALLCERYEVEIVERGLRLAVCEM
jgi:hypothetical protein